MANVIREDVIQVSWDIDNGGLSKLTSEVDKLKSSVTGDLNNGIDNVADGFDELKAAAGGNFSDGLEELKDTANKASDGLEELKDTADKIEPKGLGKLKEHLNDTNTRAGKAFAALKKLASLGFEKLSAGLDKVSTAVGKVALKAGKTALAGVGAAATGVGAIVGASVKSFADYEQLVGGVETLFKGSAGTVQNYANDAFKSAGLSANQYMETVTSFSASLIGSLGGDTAKAADMSNMAITDMADNANKMGTDMESIMGTYQSLARGNYGMLDNLKLGYGGTKEEMKRLIKEASTLDSSIKANDMSFANIVKSINAVQKEMGISGITYKEYTDLVESGKMTQEEAFKLLGTTAKEANFTVSGSLNQLKAAWSNMLTGFVLGGDSFDQSMNNLIESAEIFAGNVMPVIEGALVGVGAAVEKLAPMLAEKLPSIIQKLLPPLVKAGGTLIASVVKELPAIVSSLIPAIKQAALEIVKAFYEGFTGKEMSSDTFDKLSSAIDKIIGVAKTAVPAIIGLSLAFKGFNAVKTAVSGIKSFAKSITTIASKVTGGLPEKISGVGDGIDKAGKKSKSSSANMLASAKAFMMLAASVLLIAVAFGILAFSAISLANVGGAAIAVMFGMVAALAALGFGMSLLLKSISSIGKKAIPAATAMVILGAAVILIAAGFALFAASAIALANAGGAAIAVFAGMVVAMALLAVGAALLGTALTAGAVGFLAFGAAVLMVGAGFVLIGVAALLAAAALSIITGLLPQLSVYGLQGATAILALGAGLYVFGAGALIAGAGALVLAAGLLAVSVPLLLLTVALAIVTASFVVLAATMPILAASIMIVGTGFMMIMTSSLILAASLLPLVAAFAALAIPAAALALAIKPLANQFTKLAAGASTTASSLMSMSSSLSVTSAGFVLLKTTAKSSMDGVAKAATSAMNKFVSAVKKGMSQARAAAVSGINSIRAAFTSVNLSSTGAFMIQGLINGINSKKAAAVAAARDVANSINREFDKIEKIASPSKVWEEKGAFLIKGGIIGMQKLMPKLQAAAKTAGEMTTPYLGSYTPEGSSYSYSKATSSEYNTYSPQFNLTISGTENDRATERKVKRWIREALDDTFDGISRKSPRLQEV